MFLNNNVKFGSLNEIITFIDNVVHKESITRKYNDNEILDEDITLQECYYKIMTSCGFYYIPTEEDMLVVWEIMCKLKQEDLNRLFYKNNLYCFMDNKSMTKAMEYMLKSLKNPYLDPNEKPKEIDVELDEFCDLLMEYVYYPYQIIDRLERYRIMNRSVAIITDTDSCIVSFDGWYRYNLEKVKDVDMTIKKELFNPIHFMKVDEFGDKELINPIRFVDTPTDYDFYDDEEIELEKLINPIQIIPQESLRYSIINILAYCVGHIINDYMIRYTMNSNSFSPDRKCLLIMKNEFLFKRVLLVNAMKNYASIQEVQEGNIVPNERSLDIKGLALSKSSCNERTQERLKEIIYEDILKAEDIDQVKILKELAKFEKEIYESLRTGEKKFYKPVRIKSIASYDSPFSVFGIKQAILWNEIKNDNDPAIDFEIRNALDIVKVNIDIKSIEKMKEINEEVYNKLVELLSDKSFKGVINGLAIPKNAIIPEYMISFIDYNSIINDNLKLFPLEPLGLERFNDNNNYTNIVKL